MKNWCRYLLPVAFVAWWARRNVSCHSVRLEQSGAAIYVRPFDDVLIRYESRAFLDAKRKIALVSDGFQAAGWAAYVLHVSDEFTGAEREELLRLIKERENRLGE